MVAELISDCWRCKAATIGRGFTVLGLPFFWKVLGEASTNRTSLLKIKILGSG
jgi:hypothetical protein